jgi:hypothetical protein
LLDAYNKHAMGLTVIYISYTDNSHDAATETSDDPVTLCCFDLSEIRAIMSGCRRASTSIYYTFIVSSYVFTIASTSIHYGPTAAWQAPITRCSIHSALIFSVIIIVVVIVIGFVNCEYCRVECKGGVGWELKARPRVRDYILGCKRLLTQ